MTFKFACPKCQKSIKATSEMAGKVAKCPDCGAKLKVPTPQPAVAGAARTRAASATAKQSKPKAKPPADDGLLPFDDDEWDNALNPFEAPEADDKPQKVQDAKNSKKVAKKQLRWTKRGLSIYAAGLSISGLCFCIGFVCGFLGIEISGAFATVIACGYGFASILMLIGPYLCVAVPEATGAKQMAVVSAIAQTLAIAMGAILFYSIGSAASGGKADPTEVVAAGAILFVAAMVSYFTFVQFLKQLAAFVGEQDIANSAATVLMIGVVEGLCIVLAVIMPSLATSLSDLAWLGTIAVLCYLTAVIGGFIAGFMYVGVIFNLNAAMANR